jgi:hypothetical protein
MLHRGFKLCLIFISVIDNNVKRICEKFKPTHNAILTRASPLIEDPTYIIHDYLDRDESICYQHIVHATGMIVSVHDFPLFNVPFIQTSYVLFTPKHLLCLCVISLVYFVNNIFPLILNAV